LSYIEYRYLEDGVTATGSKIPDLPIVNLVLRVTGRNQALSGPALVDTGFDGGIYANLTIASYLEGLEPGSSERLGTPGHTIECEVYEASCYFQGPQEKKIDLGRVNVHIPTDPDDLTENVLVGREVINLLEMRLDGRKLRVRA